MGIGQHHGQAHNQQTASISTATPPELGPPITGLQLLRSLRPQRPFETGHRQLDCLLWCRPPKRAFAGASAPSAYPPLAGLSQKQHVQLEGPPGAGKTKLAVGIAVRARAASLAPPRLVEAVEALLIDADGSAHPQLLRRAASALVQSHDAPHARQGLVDEICSGIHLVRITSPAELGLFFRRLPRWLESHRKVKLVVLDSITAHTRYVSMSIGDRSAIARLVKEGLSAASSVHDCAVIVTTQLTARSTGGGGGGGYPSGAVLTPPDFKANAWSSAQLWRVCLLFNRDGSRRAVVLENEKPIKPRAGISFGIDEIGINDSQNLSQEIKLSNQ